VPVVAPVMAASSPGQGWVILAGVVGAISVVSLTMALFGQQRIKALEQELVRRQQDSQGQAIEARALAKQAQDAAQSADTKVSLLDARVAETAMQRSQLEELMGQMSRSRDENVLADLDSAVRVAMQQSALTGSTEPMAAALRQGEERLARLNQPRVERVRRALARDLDKVRAVAVTDVASLTIKLDEAIRTVDELPLVSQPERREAVEADDPPADAKATVGKPKAKLEPKETPWWAWLQDSWSRVGGRVWSEVKGLVRVTRIDNPEAVLVAPEQAWFLRENLKLRLLNARLALLSRQFDTAQSDLRDGQNVLDRYFERSARRVVLTTDLVRQVAGQAKQLNLPRPDETLAALAAAQAGR
jgi:uroporphyrin-3 C-methyltransferase